MSLFSFNLTFAGIPFVLDEGQSFRIPSSPYKEEQEADTGKAPRKHQPEESLLDEINRLIPMSYLQEYVPNCGPTFRGAGLPSAERNIPSVRIGDFYYPTGASRWSVFRALATSSQVKAMLVATAGNTARTFSLYAVPKGGPAISPVAANYSISTSLYMLPARPLGEQAGGFDGLYLVTLVDERYFFQGTASSALITPDTTWGSLIDSLAVDLGVTISYSDISSDYTGPEPDSAIWTSKESSPALLDAVALNIGRVLVRNMDGTYALLTPDESRTRLLTNLSATNRVRTAGGDLFVSGVQFPVGDLNPIRNVAVPATMTVAFPKYDTSASPVPHYINARNIAQRNTAWDEPGYGGIYTINVPISSGGSYVSGLTGVNQDTYYTTAKALFSGEAGSTPINQSGLMALALRLVQDKYTSQLYASLDQVFPGTFNWQPEGLHDLIWTYSARARQASLRVMRPAWNVDALDYQHGTPSLSGYSRTPPGVGGHTVSQAWLDQWQVASGSISGGVNAYLTQDVGSGFTGFRFDRVDYFPTQNRWKGRVENEFILFEGTSGGVYVSGGATSGDYQIDIVRRGIDGSLISVHSSGSVVTQVTPDTTYGVNVVTVERGQFTYPHEYTSGGLTGVRIIPQIQSVFSFTGSGALMNGVRHFSGTVDLFDPVRQSGGGSFIGQELVWLIERNGRGATSGTQYAGQFAGYSVSGPVAPIYIVDQPLSASVIGGSSGVNFVFSSLSGTIHLSGTSVIGVIGNTSGTDSSKALTIRSGGDGLVEIGIQNAGLDQYGVLTSIDQNVAGRKSFFNGVFINQGSGIGSTQGVNVLLVSSSGDPGKSDVPYMGIRWNALASGTSTCNIFADSLSGRADAAYLSLLSSGLTSTITYYHTVATYYIVSIDPDSSSPVTIGMTTRPTGSGSPAFFINNKYGYTGTRSGITYEGGIVVGFT